MQCIKQSAKLMSQTHFNFYVQFFVHIWNVKKAEFFKQKMDIVKAGQEWLFIFTNNIFCILDMLKFDYEMIFTIYGKNITSWWSKSKYFLILYGWKITSQRSITYSDLRISRICPSQFCSGTKRKGPWLLRKEIKKRGLNHA